MCRVSGGWCGMRVSGEVCGVRGNWNRLKLKGQEL